jgi:NCS2 family nucleobase:cation symporter-2
MTRRPEELDYAVDETPPPLKLLALGLQHAVLVSVYLVLVVVVVRAAKAPEAVVLSMLSFAMLALAAAAVLQALPRGPVGSGYLAVPVYSAIYLGPSVLAAEAGGLPAVFGMTIFAGAVEVVLSRFLRPLRGLFPPAVSGFIVCIVGIELGLVGVSQALAVEAYEAGALNYAAHLAAAAVTLCVGIGLSVWATGFLRLVCSLAALVAGVAVAVAGGLVSPQHWAALAGSPWLALPDPGFLAYSFEPAVLPAFLAAAIAATLRTIGVVTTCQKLNDSDWKRPDMRTLKGGALADGLGCMVAGLAGAPGLNAAPSLVGVSSAARATSRSIAYACAAILVVAALTPKVGAFFLALPLSVAGGLLVFSASLMIAGGIGIMVSRTIDIRATFVIGLSLLLALGTKVYPTYFADLPQAVHTFTGGVLATGVFASVLLTLLFRIGIRRRASLRLADGSASLEEFLRILGERGRAWKIAPDVLSRATESAAEAVRELRAAGILEQTLAASISYDDVDLTVELAYEGSVLRTPERHLRRRNLVEEESFAYGLANFLTAVHPDRVSTRSDGRTAILRMDFSA